MRSLGDHRPFRAACVIGTLLALYSFFSFTTGMLGLAMLVMLVRNRSERGHPVAACDYVDDRRGPGLQLAVRYLLFRDRIQHARVPGGSLSSRGRIERPIFRSPGAIPASRERQRAGISRIRGPVSRLSGSVRSDDMSVATHSCSRLSSALAPAYLGITGLGQLETERIWVFFTPLLRVAAAPTSPLTPGR